MPGGNPDVEKRNANLKPWKPGQSGNPSGRPKRQPISDAYRKFADRPNGTAKKRRRPKNLTLAEAAAFEQYRRAIDKGDTRAITEIREAIEGKATQRIELSGIADGPPIVVQAKVDLSIFTTEELVQYRDLIAKATSRRQPG